MLPVLNPAYTENYEGFNHLSNLKGAVEEAHMHYIIRNHDKTLFLNKRRLRFNQNYMNAKYGYDAVELTITDSYFNMYDILKDHMYVIDIAKEAIKNVGLVPNTEPIRGVLTELDFVDGLMCPNLGTGGYNFHGRFEFASMIKQKKR